GHAPDDRSRPPAAGHLGGRRVERVSAVLLLLSEHGGGGRGGKNVLSRRQSCPLRPPSAGTRSDSVASAKNPRIALLAGRGCSPCPNPASSGDLYAGRAAILP